MDMYLRRHANNARDAGLRDGAQPRADGARDRRRDGRVRGRQRVRARARRERLRARARARPVQSRGFRGRSRGRPGPHCEGY